MQSLLKMNNWTTEPAVLHVHTKAVLGVSSTVQKQSVCLPFTSSRQIVKVRGRQGGHYKVQGVEISF